MAGDSFNCEDTQAAKLLYESGAAMVKQQKMLPASRTEAGLGPRILPSLATIQ